MSTATKTDFITVEQYLAMEQQSEIKHEYVDGYLVAMGGASPNHCRISGNIAREFGNHLKGKPCEPFASDMKVKTPSGQYRYPDVLVACDNVFVDNGQATQSPVLIVEVLSHSTRRADEKAKLLEYINIPTLKEYMLVEQDFADVRVLRKSDDWRTTHYFLGEEIYFESIDLTLPVAEIYDRVDNQDMTEFLTNAD